MVCRDQARILILRGYPLCINGAISGTPRILVLIAPRFSLIEAESMKKIVLLSDDLVLIQEEDTEETVVEQGGGSVA